jgi:penicillin-binding protein 2
VSAPGVVVTHGEGRPDQRRIIPRLAVFGAIIVLAVAGLGLRLFQLQLSHAAEFQESTTVGLATTRAIPVARGLIYDRKGRLLVENVPTFVMRILPAELPHEQRPEVADRISRLTDIPARKVIERLDAHIGSQLELVRIADVSTETARVISEDAASFPGVRVDLEARRRYLLPRARPRNRPV